ncbi:hypothetical protein [Pseudomonas nitroreducens]|uniref:Uncharacterized protein n=1 Tax=Pseudomonas nitroreducens TaxID=46680 RepID=A0A6G6IUD1_PSENT|nr:hypothetical protein [Pseudomonas nitroreducens]QIE86745.1 hypothetical protein G5B91_10850 [Pseudomonas nitroreducens]
MNIVIPGWLAVLIILICASKVIQLQAGWTAEQPIQYPAPHPAAAGR